MHGPWEYYQGEQKYPLFFFEFEYFAQKDISGLIDETLEKACLFHHEEADGIGLISALIAMTNLKAHLEFLDEEQATE